MPSADAAAADSVDALREEAVGAPNRETRTLAATPATAPAPCDSSATLTPKICAMSVMLKAGGRSDESGSSAGTRSSVTS